MEALYYKAEADKKVRCTLCPHACLIKPGRTGSCLVRENQSGTLIPTVYGKPCSVRFDPIEKKPLYHFYPGSEILSVGSFGCNLHCRFCQNHEISQNNADAFPKIKEVSPEEIVHRALQHKNNTGLAYTYNEPTVWYEYMLDIARLAWQKGLKNAMITNGFINREPLKELMQYMDAFNVDLKAFNNEFYRKYTSAGLEPLKQRILDIRDAGKHLEITNLVITGLNDDEQEFSKMVEWIAGYAGRQTPLHISRYHPVYQLRNEPTSLRTMLRLYDIAKDHLDYVYMGNVQTSQGHHTNCPSCGTKVIERSGYSTTITALDPDGICSQCGFKVLTA